MKVAIVGSRGYSAPTKVVKYVRLLPRDTVVISGGAAGVDTWAEAAALFHGLETIVFPAQWDRHGRAAGMMRNSDIVGVADRLVAFWDGVSRGTEDSINQARARGIPVEVIAT